jgi:tetratricopeptide (TPR) repeat protein
MRRAEEAFVGTSRFDVRGRLGDGGGGVVYRAHDRKFARDVALKVMRDAEGDGMARFRASFPSLKRSSHPNLVQLLDLIEDAGRLLLIMELVEGLELHEYVRHVSSGNPLASMERLPFDELRLRSVFLQLAQALYALHADRKVHRDVKPSNVRVTPEGRAVLLDLDLSLDLDAEVRESNWPLDVRPVGTALYMAPEQASSEAATFASDWYSFGVVLYEALTGALPYHGNDLEILLKKQDVAPTPPEELVPNLPSDLATLCRDLLVADPAQRPLGVQVLHRLGLEEETVSQKLTLTSILSTRPAFVGREHEIERLLDAVERARSGPYVVRVAGEPGAGKTTLCEELLRRLSRDPRHPLVLTGVCPRYPDRPHAALGDPVARLVDALRDAPAEEKLKLGQGALRLLERMFGTSVAGLEEVRGRSAIPPDPLEQRFRAIDSLRAMLATVAAERPLVLWLDDYQWADIDTQRLIGALLRGSDPLCMLVVLSEDPPPGELQSSLPSADEVIALTGLTRQAARALAEQLGERAGDARSALNVSYYRDALPLVIQERVRYALFFGAVPSGSLGLAAMIEARAAALSLEARKVLEIVCAAHDPLPQDVCGRASGLTRASFSRQLSTLRIGAFVRCFSARGEDFVAPSHWAVVGVLESRVQLARPQIHAMLTSALSAREQARASARLLRHQSESGDQRSAAQSALAAAHEAERALAFQRAAQLLSLSASLQPARKDEAGAQLMCGIADALSNAGWSLDAANMYREAGQLATGVNRVRMRQRAVEHFLRAAEHELGFEAVEELLDCFDLRLPTSSRAAFWSLLQRRVLVRLRGFGFREASEGQVAASDLRHIDALWATGVRLVMVDMMRGADLLARGVSKALSVGEPRRVARALCTEAWTLLGYKRSHIAHVERVVETARALIERQPSPLLDGHLKVAEGMLAVSRFAMPKAYARFRDAERVLRSDCTDVAWEITMSQVYQIIALAETGRFGEAFVKYETSTHEARERGDLWGHAQLKTIGAIGVKLVRDLPNEAAEDIREAIVHWDDAGDLHMQHVVALMASTYVDLYRGVPRALEGLDAKWPQLKRQFFLYVRFPRATLLELRGRARVLSAKRRKDPALLRAAEADARTLLAQDEGPEHGFGRMLLANVLAQRGQSERAIELLGTAIGELEGHGLELWSLCGRYVLGRLLGGDAGQAQRAQARSTLLSRGTVNVGRLVSMMLPGFEEE